VAKPAKSITGVLSARGVNGASVTRVNASASDARGDLVA